MNNAETSRQIRAGMEQAYAAFRSAFPNADKVNFTAEVYDGRFNCYGSVLLDRGWTSGITLDSNGTIDGAIESIRSRIDDPAKLRAEAAELLKRAAKIDGGAK